MVLCCVPQQLLGNRRNQHIYLKVGRELPNFSASLFRMLSLSVPDINSSRTSLDNRLPTLKVRRVPFEVTQSIRIGCPGGKAYHLGVKCTESNVAPFVPSNSSTLSQRVVPSSPYLVHKVQKPHSGDGPSWNSPPAVSSPHPRRPPAKQPPKVQQRTSGTTDPDSEPKGLTETEGWVAGFSNC